MKDKKIPRNYPQLEEINETSRVNAMWDPELDHESEKDN